MFRRCHPTRPPRRPGIAALVVIAVLLLLASGNIAGVGAQQGAPRVDLVTVDGAITPPTAQYVTRAIAGAESDGASAVVIALDTPGGLMSSMDAIVDAILASRVPVVVYVSPPGGRAASAGVFVTEAAHVAAMAPTTRIGSASPVMLGPDGQPSGGDPTMNAKITNDAVSQITNLARLRGRNEQWAEQAVRSAANLTADEAVRQHVVDLAAPDLATLLKQIDGRTVTTAAGPVTLHTAGATVEPVERGFLDHLLQLLSDPTIAYLLVSLGTIALFFELTNPGAIVPGVVGALALLLGLYGLGTLPVNWAGLLLIGLAFALLVADLYVPSFGALTLGGLVSFVLGSYLLLGSDAPSGLRISPIVIWTVSGLLLAFFLALGGLALATRFRKPATGREGLVGTVGTVRQRLNPDGVVFVAGELWQATALATLPPGTLPIEPETAVAVTGLDGLRMVVRPATAAEVAASGVSTVGDRLHGPAEPADPSERSPA